MVSNVDDLKEQFKGFDLMIKQMLDKMSSFEAWRTTTDASLGSLLTKTTEAVLRINHLEKTLDPPPPPPPPSSPPSPPPPASWLGGVDLNFAPILGGRPYASLEKQPSGHGVGGGVLGSPPLISH